MDGAGGAVVAPVSEESTALDYLCTVGFGGVALDSTLYHRKPH